MKKSIKTDLSAKLQFYSRHRPLIIMYMDDCVPEDDEFWPEVSVLCEWAHAMEQKEQVRHSMPPRIVSRADLFSVLLSVCERHLASSR